MQPNDRSLLLRPRVAIGLVLIAVFAMLGWRFVRTTTASEIRIATASEKGRYFEVGELLAGPLRTISHRDVRVMTTEGSLDNLARLRGGAATLGLIQLGAGDARGTAAVAPLYPEVVHVVVRRGLGIAAVAALDGRRVVVGPLRSGMQRSARAVLEHYRIEVEAIEDHFSALDRDATIEAAIVTTGLLNPELVRLLASGDFDLVPIDDAEALSVQFSYFEISSIPRGLYSGRPVVPPHPVETVSTMTYLAVADDASNALVTNSLQALYTGLLHGAVPGLLDRAEASDWSAAPAHPAARSFFDPYQGLGLLANFMETIAAAKELLFALGAGFYVGWTAWRRRAQREEATWVHAQKDRLDEFLEETTEIERLQMTSHEVSVLRGYLDEITRIKLRAIEELTHEKLRGDRMFSIFLQQCSALSEKIESKIDRVLHGDLRDGAGAGRPDRADGGVEEPKPLRETGA